MSQNPPEAPVIRLRSSLSGNAGVEIPRHAPGGLKLATLSGGAQGPVRTLCLAASLYGSLAVLRPAPALEARVVAAPVLSVSHASTADVATTADSVSWANIPDKPAVFPPDSTAAKETDLAAAQSQLAALQAQANNLLSQIQALQSELTGDETVLSGHGTRLMSLESSRTTDEANIATLASASAAYAAAIGSLQASRTTDEGNIATLQSASAAYAAAIATLQSDPRWSNARTPTPHAASHGKNGSDAVSLDWSQLTSGVPTIYSPDGTTVVSQGATLSVGAIAQNQVSGLSGRLNTDETSISANSSAIAANTTNIAANAAGLAALLLYRLDQWAKPTANIDLNSKRIINLSAPSGNNDAARLVDVNGVTIPISQVTGLSSRLSTDESNISQSAGAITALQGYRLDQWAVPTADVSLNNHKLTGVAAPVASTDAARKSETDANAANIATNTTNIAANTTAIAARMVTATFVGSSTPGSNTNEVDRAKVADGLNASALDGSTLTESGGVASVGSITQSQVAGLIAALAAKLASGTTLDQIAQAVASVNLNGQRASNAGAPTSSSDLTTKSYVDTADALRMLSSLFVGASSPGSNSNEVDRSKYADLLNATAVDGATLTVSSGVASVGAIAESKVTNLTSDLAAKMAASTTLDAIPAAAANVSLNSKRITSLADPSSAQDAASKNYVDTPASSSAAGRCPQLDGDTIQVRSSQLTATQNVPGDATRITFDDFDYSTNIWWQITTANTGGGGTFAAIGANYGGVNNGLGYGLLQSGANATFSGCFARLSAAAFTDSKLPFDWTYLVSFLALSNATDTYRGRLGAIDNQSATTTGNILTIEHGGTSTANWRLAVGTDSAPTYTDLGVAPAAKTPTVVRIAVNSGWTQVKAYVNGSLLATVTTGIPSALYWMPGWRFTKSAGTTSLTMAVDCFWMRVFGRTPSF